MLFFIKCKPALGWVMFLVLTHWAQGGGATPLATLQSPSLESGAPLALDDWEVKWIKENSHVIVASMQFPLYLFKDETGQWDGLNHEILQRIAQMTGLDFVHRESFSPDQLLTTLENGEADMTTLLAMNDERRHFLHFSHAFGGAGWVFVGRDGESAVHSLEQLQGKILALPVRHALEAEIRRDYPAIQLRTVKTYGEARALVESREAHATIESETGVHLYPAGQLQVGTSLEGRWAPDYLAVRQDLTPLLGILNKALEAFPAKEMRALRAKWLSGIDPTQPPSFWQRTSRWGYWCGIAAVLFGLLSLLWTRRLQARVDQRLKAETVLKDQLMLQKALMDAIPEPIFIRDLEGRLIMCNKSYEDQFATRFEKLRGTRLTDCASFPQATAELLHGEVMEQLRTGQSRYVDRQLLFSSGLREIYQWSVPFYGGDGQLRGLLGGWVDVRRRRLRSDRLLA
jgi:ABC-type amino acid transport substrate-binding protein